MPVLMSGSLKVIWKYNTISTDELRACFPSSTGLIMIQSSTKEAIKAQDGQFFLQNDEQYFIPAPINQGKTSGMKLVTLLEMYSLQLTMKLDRMQEKINMLENEIEMLKKKRIGELINSKSLHASLQDSMTLERNLSDVSLKSTQDVGEDEDSLNLSIVSKKYLEQLNKR